jgi:hypothetical protein
MQINGGFRSSLQQHHQMDFQALTVDVTPSPDIEICDLLKAIQEKK